MSTRTLRTRQPRATAPISSSTPPRSSRRKAKASSPTMKAAPNGEELLGRLIEVAWPSDDDVVYYIALVIGCTRRNQHKVIYIEDESIETLQLGSGPPYRTWRPTELPSDNLVGARIRFVDNKPSSSGESWFDFMRANPSRRNPPFEVYVYARVGDPDPSEVSGPREITPGTTNYYRIVHAPNDYLTTVDLSSVDYVIVEPIKQPDPAAEDDDLPPVIIEPHASVDDLDSQPRPIDDTIDAVIIDEDVPPARSRIRSNAARSKTVDVIPDDQNLPENSSKLNLKGDAAIEANPGSVVIKVSLDDVANDGVEAKSTDVDFVKDQPVEDTQRDALGIDANKKDDVLDLLNDVDEGAETAPDILRIPDPSDPSSALDETNDALVYVPLDVDKEPASKAKNRTRRKIENDDADTASEDEKLGSAPSEPAGTTAEDIGDEEGSQAGDYIMLDTGDGGPRRKAYVTAYLPSQRSHFVTFCDAKGGTTQIKLTKDNHSQMDDKDVEALTRAQARQVFKSAPAEETVHVIDAVGRSVEVGDEREAERPIPVKREKRRASSFSKPSGTSTFKKKAKRPTSTMKVLGKSAGKEIVSRCVTVVWPNTKLVYVALVMGYSPESNQHMLIYMSDHCVEVLELKYREWELLARGKEPWNSSGMVGRRIYVWWPGEYEEEDKQEIAEEMFGEGKTKVAYEAYILTFIGKTKYKIVYPCNEDCEERELDAAKTEGTSAAGKEWDLLEEGVHEVAGLPVIGWES